MRLYRNEILLLSGMCLIPVACNPAKNADETTQQIKVTAHRGRDHESHQGGHIHYGAGPHGGSLLELGGDDYHAELVLDHDAHAVRIFLLKSDVKTPLPTKTPEVLLTLDNGEKRLLNTVPLQGETDGEASCFELADDEFFHQLVERGFLHGDLSIQIDGGPFEAHLDGRQIDGPHRDRLFQSSSGF
jgi:hypothetical protein